MMKQRGRDIKFLLSVIFTLVALLSYTQEERKVERLWASVNCSFARYVEGGAQIQIFDQFLIGAYAQALNRKVGPGVPENPNALFWTKHYYKKDLVNSGALMIGFASPTPHRAIFSFLGGPSLNQIITNSNFKTNYSSNSAHYITSVSSEVTEQWKFGVNYRATVSFVLGDYVCLNFGLAGNHNGVDNYYRFIFGLGFGEFGCEKRPKKYDRVVIYR